MMFAIGVFCIIMLPIVLMGYPYAVSDLLKYGQVYADTGRIVDPREPLLPAVLSLFHPFADWNNINAWVAISVAWFCASLLPLWWCVRMLCDKSTAWFAVVTFAFLPLTWESAYSVSGYSFALLPFFLSCSIFIVLHEKRPTIALLASGLLFGITLGIQHSFLAFMPWFFLGYLWHERRHLIMSIVRAGLFCAAAYLMFMAPYFPHALEPGLSPVERIMVFSPLAKEAKPGEGHLYPDAFLFEHYKKEYDEEMEKNAPSRSFIKNQEDLNYRIIFGTGNFTIFHRILSGTWLMLNSIPDFFMMDYVGGTFLWLFILPGIVVLWRTRRTLALSIAGLIVSMECLLRYFLLFTSSHLNNYHWALALFAGLGITAVVTALARSWKLTSKQSVVVGVLIAVIVGTQLLQANRKQLARMYARSRTPEVLAATEVLKSVPADAIVASPRRSDLFILSPQRHVTVHPLTMEFLSKRGKLAEPFDFYGVQYMIGYDKEQQAAIRHVAPYVKVIELPETPPVPPLGTFVRYVLNTIR